MFQVASLPLNTPGLPIGLSLSHPLGDSPTMTRLLVAACLAAVLAVAWPCRCHEAVEQAAALPRSLSTSSRWIVDERGRRVKLACVNWPSHLEPVLAEGLGHRPLGTIAMNHELQTPRQPCIRSYLGSGTKDGCQRSSPATKTV